MSPTEFVRPPLDRARLDAVVQQEEPWSELLVLDEAGSTNEVAAERAATASSGLVVVAEHQTSGHGRLGRTWVTPARSAVTVSFLLRPAVPAPRWLWLPLLAGVAAADALEAVAGVRVDLKWPNDVLIGGRKVGGILARRIEPGGAAGVPDPVAVVGIGINVSLTPEELPVPEATSLEIATGHPVDRTAVLAGLLATLGSEYTAWERAGGDPVYGLGNRYSARCSTLGTLVTAQLPSGQALTGTAREVDDDGMLVVDTDEGPRTVAAADVTHVRVVE
jgi:BirA family biotin operon repressor/biotin-[acetyl-CoA-carboxylase] ligase